MLVLCICLYPQQKTADSLVNQLSKLSSEKRVDALNEISDIYINIDTRTSTEYGLQALKLAESINYAKGIACSYSNIGFSYINVDNPKAIEYTRKSLELSRKLNNQAGIATSLNVLGIIYYYEGDYHSAIDNHLNALKIREELGEDKKIATSLNNIALVHIALNNYETALEYLNRGLAIREKNKDKKRIAIVYDNIGDVYSKMGKYDKAFDYMKKALAIHNELGNVQLMANSYANIAVVYRHLGDTSNALKYYNESLKIYTAHGSKNGLAFVEGGIAAIYQMEGKTNQAVLHALAALDNAQLIHSLENISTAANILQKEYYKTGDYIKAYHYLSVYVNAKDSLINIDKVKKLSKKEYDYRVEQLRKEQDARIEKQNLSIYALSITLVLIIIIFSLIYSSYRQKRKSNEKLSVLNKRLQDLNSTKDKFFSIIAHDLKSPFLGLMGYSQILSEEYADLKEDERKTYIGYIYELTKSTYKLLENLLEWSRLQTGKIEFNPDTLNIYDALFPTLDLLAKTAQNKRISIEPQIDKDLVLKADKYMLQAVVRNLISNSIKFTQPNGHIIINAKKDDHRCVVSVQDDGVGMNKATVNTLFRIDVTKSTKGTVNEEGTGLGLLLCKEMIERHNGKIWAESEEGGGSKFYFSLPYSQN